MQVSISTEKCFIVMNRVFQRFYSDQLNLKHYVVSTEQLIDLKIDYQKSNGKP
jgi:hypothetical protein